MSLKYPLNSAAMLGRKDMNTFVSDRWASFTDCLEKTPIGSWRDILYKLDSASQNMACHEIASVADLEARHKGLRPVITNWIVKMDANHAVAGPNNVN